MSAVALARLRDLFWEDAARPAVARAAERAVPTMLALLAAPADAVVAGEALGLAAASATGAPCALVCVWSGAEATALPSASRLAVGAARRLVARLEARGLPTVARGRVVVVALPASEAEARAAAERAVAAAGETPVVVVLAAPRSNTFDGLLAELERTVVVPPAGAPLGLEHLVVEEAARTARAVGVLRPPRAGGMGSRMLRASGLMVSTSWRRAGVEALEGGVDRG